MHLFTNQLQNKTNILFIINPISGGKKKSQLPTLIDKYLDKDKFNANFSFTEYIGHAAEIAEEAAQKHFDVIVAAGGDGTINEIATQVLLQDKILGIIPLGSGNGLARFLKIPMELKKAIQVINKLNHIKVDTATFNQKRFFNMAGMGFDAHISSVFAGNKKRGLAGYVKLGLKEISKYKAQTYSINIDGVDYQRQAFALSVANSSQYGNNAFVSPKASVTDGLLDVCIIKPFPLYKLPIMGYVMFNAKGDKSNMIEILKGKDIKISRPFEDAVHVDGEPFFMGENIEISINPLSLNIIIP